MKFKTAGPVFLIMVFLLAVVPEVCLGQVSIQFKSDVPSFISFKKKDRQPLPFSAEFGVNSEDDIKDMSGYNFKLEMFPQIANSKTIWGQLFVHAETEYTKVSNVDINITNQDILQKVLNGEVPIIIIRDPSENEQIICRIVFGNRELKLKGFREW